ncbi:MAG: PD-(D/E)XK nuclease family protein [Algicola sp.]|nr:PD-(D/E)XK nuclease family protein [Algicola sp.]
MISFLEDVIIDLKKQGLNIPDLTFVLPSKRAGIFLKHTLHKHVEGAFFSPEITSIESFIESLSTLEYISNTELFFEFYEAYLKVTPKEQIEPFDSFYKWAQRLLQDFNEIDRYLVPPDKIFNYLSAIKEIELDHWSLEENQTPYIKNYLDFWSRLGSYYHALTNRLTAKQKGYQGLVYRQAVNNLEHYIATLKGKTIVFVGFNALNKAEELIIQELLQQDLAQIYWDLDQHFFTDTIHDAGHFIRTHTNTWPYFKNNPLNWISNHYSSPKQIQITGVPKNVGQVKYIGTLLDELNLKQGLKNTAVVLGNESLLIPLLNALPKTINGINITMGLPLVQIPLASLFEKLFSIHKSTSKAFYYKDVVAILSHEYIRPLFQKNDTNAADDIIEQIQQNNIISITRDEVTVLAPENETILGLLFKPWNETPLVGLQNCKALIQEAKRHLNKNKSKNLLQLEYLYRFNEIFNSLETLIGKHDHIQSTQTLHSMYKELIKQDTLDFQGEPLQGLQIMGMLESRVLDFETVIIASVNEGILPAGKSQNSFIPFDVKIENNLPTYKEKDAVYTYHFYRLLQRAKQVYILYNTEPDVLNGGEKSRFITQLDIEKVHELNVQTVTPVVPPIKEHLIEVAKHQTALSRLKEIAQRGFSPSSLTNYIRNPLDFYAQKILSIKAYDDVEETVAANTLGTVLHNTLEKLYKPFEGAFLSEKMVLDMTSKIDHLVQQEFKELFKKGNTSTGKNLIIFEIAKRYVYNVLKEEIACLKEGHQIKIIAIEQELKTPINVPGLDFPVFLTGKVDRVDEFNGTLRIIDYKSGKVEPGQLKINHWEELTTDYNKYSKPFQLLAYAFMIAAETPFSGPVTAGIISFKNLSKGVMAFQDNKDPLITQATLQAFEEQLNTLILELFDPNIPFKEKPIT